MKKEKFDYEVKSFKFEIKEITEEGIFTGYAAIFDVVDSGGDIIAPGAFKKTLREKKHFPMLWVHDTRTPLGIVYLKEDEKGLWVKRGELNLEVQKAKEVHALMKQEAIQELSFGYDTIQAELDTLPKGAKRRLKEVKLYEVSPVVFAMQELAKIEEVKADDMGDEPAESKPSKENHVCRVNDGEYIRYRSETRKHNGKPYTIRFGTRKSDGKSEEYEYFYPVEHWSAPEARAHCKEHEGKFEAAIKSIEEILNTIIEWDKKDCPTCPAHLTSEQSELIAKAIKSLTALREHNEPPGGTRLVPEPQNLEFIIKGLNELRGSNEPQRHSFDEITESLKNLMEELK